MEFPAAASNGALGSDDGVSLAAWVAIGSSVLSLALAVVVLLAVHSQKKNLRHERKEIDAAYHLPRLLPSTLPIVGNLLQLVLNASRFHDWITECCEFFQGETFAMEMPLRLNPVFVYTPQGVEDVLKTHFDSIHKGPYMHTALHDVFGNGIFAVDGLQWAYQRKTASHLFSTNALRGALSESVEKSTAALLRVLETAGRSSDKVIDIYQLMSRFTIQAFAQMGFGVDLNCLEREDDHPFQLAFDSAQRILTQRFIRPTWFWKIQRVLSVGLEGQLKRDIEIIDTTVMEIITQSLARRQRQQSGTLRGDIVSLFLDRYDGEKDGDSFEPNYLRDMVVNFLIAGRDTTAQAMSWCLYNLSHHPEVAMKIRNEMERVLPEFASGHRSHPLTMEEVQQLVYLEATLKETLRLHPSVPVIPKTVLSDTVLSDGTFLPAGTEITIPTYAMGRMAFIWGPDAKQFKPERWIDPTTNQIVGVSAYQFIAFNAGPRMCLGMALAMAEMKIVLASVLRRFQLELVLPGQQLTYDRSMTLSVKGTMGAHVRVSGASVAG
jgi:cytochrome P450